MAQQHPIDFSRTERIVLLIDLHPLLQPNPNPNPNSYLKAVLSSAQTLLRFPPLSSSLFSFKLFFSSLSPLLSSSMLRPFIGTAAAASSLSFHHPPHTLSSLARTLDSLPPLLVSPSSAHSKASLTASSLLQLVHDYAWDHSVHDLLGTNDYSPFAVRSNLVVLLSPIPYSLECLSLYTNVRPDDELLMDVDAFSKGFCEIFATVNGAFLGRDIHCCWVDVNCRLGYDEDKVEAIDESVVKLGLFENGIRRLGWGLCSSESIVLGSALVPFGLIYPKVGTLSKPFDSNDCCKANCAQLNLEILDVNGKPLECKCCDLDLINLKKMPRPRHCDVLHAREVMNQDVSGCEWQKSFLSQCGDGMIKLHIKAVQKYDTCIKTDGYLSDVILVRGSSAKIGKEKNGSSSEFFADRVLKMLSAESSKFFLRKAVPIWQILLSFLYREGYWALVSLSNGNGNSCTGILKPFTIHSGLIFVIDNEFLPQKMADCFGDKNLINFANRTDGVCIPNVRKDHSKDFIDSQSGTLSLKRHVALGNKKCKKFTKQSHLHKNLNWSSFCKEASEHSDMVLEEIYFARGCNSSKKLKFLKCWMKQIKKSSNCCLSKPDETWHQEVVSNSMEGGPSGLHQQNEQLVYLSILTGVDSLTESSRIQAEAEPLPHSETSEAFFSSLSGKIQHGLQSEQVDLGALAERLVDSSIHLLYQKCDVNADFGNQTPVIESDNICYRIVSEVTKVLLLEPKDLAAKHKASNPKSPKLASEYIVREYELQILFRMEILLSVVAGNIDESTKLIFVKQICSLLEKVQCHLEGGFFGGTSLDEYVKRTISSRYSHALGDVVHRIYRKMDLLLFEDEDELPNALVNSEDSNQSWKEKLKREESGEKGWMVEGYSAEDECSQPLENANGKNEEHSRRLIVAQQRREKARRFASFARMPDLHRVWAPKQPMAMKAKSDYVQKLLKRKDCQRTSYDIVCETPITGNKCSRRPGRGTGFKGHEDSYINSSACVSKALFQDD